MPFKKGYKITESHRLNLRKALKGLVKTTKHRKNLSKVMKGKPSWVKGMKWGEFRDYGTEEKSTAWKGDDVGYAGLHSWVRKYKPIPKKCERCGEEKKLQASNNSGEYKRDLSDWEYICAKCHVYKDGTINNLIYGKNKKTNREKRN
jgi:hypothetical protein